MILEAERARPQDLAPALELLAAASLPTETVADQFGHYFVVRDVGRVVGVVGLEVHGAHGLLRSAVVEPGYQGRGSGRVLVNAALGLARHLELEAVYLLTTTARDFFIHVGFTDWERAQAPGAIRDSWEFRQGCPDTAAFMRLSIAEP